MGQHHETFQQGIMQRHRDLQDLVSERGNPSRKQKDITMITMNEQDGKKHEIQMRSHHKMFRSFFVKEVLYG